jgi:transposase
MLTRSEKCAIVRASVVITLIVDLKNIIELNWTNSLFMSLSTKADIREQIIEHTSFLDKYYDNIQLRARAYCIKNDITEDNLPQCKCNCGKPAALNKTFAIKGFRIYCGPVCHRKDSKIDNESLDKLKDYDWVYDQRIVKKVSIEKIAEQLKISAPTVDRWLIKHNLKNVIKNVRCITEDKLKLLQDKEILKQYYFGENLTAEQIASTLEISSYHVYNWLKKHNIKLRSSNEYTRKKKFTSKAEEEILKYVKKYCKKDIISNDRKVLRGKELDVLIPDLKLAVEYNGIFSHIYRPNETKACLRKDENYHLNKTVKCLENDIQLIQLFSSEWTLKENVVKGIIRRKLLKNKRVSSIDCSVREVNKNVANTFLKNNCIFGELEDEFSAFGLYYKNKLVQVICYNDNVILRNSCKIGISVIGGFKTLLGEILKINNQTLYFDVDRRFSNGNLLKSYGFVLDRVIEPKYYYTDKSYDELFDSEFIENYCVGREDYCFYCEKPQYKKIYDCGYLRFKL